MAGIFISCFPIFPPNMSGISDIYPLPPSPGSGSQPSHLHNINYVMYDISHRLYHISSLPGWRGDGRVVWSNCYYHIYAGYYITL